MNMQCRCRKFRKGAGNTAFFLLSANKNPKLMIRAFDYSWHAIKSVLANSSYHDPLSSSNKQQCGISHVKWRGVAPDSVHMVLVSVLSALHPDEWEKAVRSIHQVYSQA